ncbi:ComEA family DNA-binding protein [Virgisporangium ochraceum]|nr:ComEA family DNA-binding protein [Virgisporangium ochraceum]
MPFRRSRSAVSEVDADPVVAARLTRVVGPESGVFRLVADQSDAVGSVGSVGFADGPRFAGEAALPEDPPDPAKASRALAAFDPGRRAVRALGVCALVVALVVGFLVWRSRPRAEPVAAGADAATVAPAPPSSAAVGIVVSVVGRVHRPGLVRLAHGSRVADAIEAAGGVLPGTDLGFLNLARKVVDGELLAIGVSAPPVAPGAGPAAGAPGGLVNLNTATAAELDALPGVGPVLAQRIIDHRTRTGGFRSVEELRKVEGVGDARFEQLKDLVTV